MVALYDFREGSGALLISMPHCGTHIPPHLAAEMTPKALEVPDTDFHLPRLYDFAGKLGASLVSATHSRYVIDLNRSPDGIVLYPGARVLSLVFLVFFYQLLNVPAVIVLGLWFVLQLLSGVGSLGGSADGGVAFFAHIGGFVAGLVIGLLVRAVGARGGRAGQPSGRVGVG